MKSIESVRNLYQNVGKLVIPYSRIKKKVAGLAAQINAKFKRAEVVLISNLKGSFRFLSDLCSRLTIPVRIDFVAFTSYVGTSNRSGEVRIIKDLKMDVAGRHVIIVEDIVDTGLTLEYMMKYLEEFKGAASVSVCSLLDKVRARKVPVKIHFRGFAVPDRFLVGYGLDYHEYFRELNGVFEYTPEYHG